MVVYKLYVLLKMLWIIRYALYSENMYNNA